LVASRSDTNARVGALLRDLAAVQQSPQSRWGYKRASAAILSLDEPLENLVQPDGTLRKIPGIGPSSSRVILEYLQTGRSPTVERAVQESSRAGDVMRSRELREHFLSRSQVMAALRDAKLRGPHVDDYRGDLQMHSLYSDGGDTLATIVEGCLARGWSYCAVTDHSYGLPIAGGVPMEKLKQQHREIDSLNKRYKGRFRMLKGIEANILADGRVDMTLDELRRLEIVVASPHSKLRSSADQTARMLAAISTPGVHILGHPRGRMFGSRPGVSADWDRVFRTAAKLNVAVEIDGDPARQDIDYSLARRAIRAGCVFAVDSDAHAVSQFHYVEIALAHARLAGVPRSRVINCWPVDDLLTWAERAWNR
jgi:histidinol phosphatase-like PHP family hydrolase